MNVEMQIKKKLILFCLSGLMLASCSDVRRDPGRIYMPDMAYSRAYETYSVTPEQREALLKEGYSLSAIPLFPEPSNAARFFHLIFRKIKQEIRPIMWLPNW